MTDSVGLVDQAEVQLLVRDKNAHTPRFVAVDCIIQKFDENASPGKLAKHAASHLMKLLYAARLCRGAFYCYDHLSSRETNFQMVDK